jgi:2-C-methyl-D-erythritol 4-phosphate cytidylyltransferase
MSDASNIGVVLPAGGKGLRVGGTLPKQFQDLGGKPMLCHSLKTFYNHPTVCEVVLVLPEAMIESWQYLKEEYPKLRFTTGGLERWNSVCNGVQALSKHKNIQGVLVHDVARPFVPVSVLERCIEKVLAETCVVVAEPSPNTVKEVEGSKVVRTLDRNKLIQVQTPQGFPLKTLQSIYSKLEQIEKSARIPTDEAALVEQFEYKVDWVPGHPWLHKVTTSEDMAWAKWMCERIKQAEIVLE